MHLTLRRDRSRPTVRHLLVATAAIAAGTVTLVAAPMAHAANPTLNAPERVYTGVGQTLNFTGTDSISGDNRLISVGVSDGACNTGGPNYSISGCSRLQITLNDQSGGHIFIAGNHVETKPDSQPVIVAESGAIVDVSTDPNGGPGFVLHLSGTQTQINQAVDGLQYIPVAGFESGADVSPFANIHMIAVNGTNQAETTTRFVEIRIEGQNGAPVLTAPLTPLTASTSQSVAFPADTSLDPLFDLIDPELCTVALCGAGFPNPSIDSDDKVLIVASLEGCTQSTFNFRGGAFTTLGSPTLNNVHTVLTAVGGLDLENDQAAAVEASIPAALALDFTGQAGGPTSPTAVFAGVGEFDEVKYALSQVTFDTAQTDDTTCTFNISVTDLGNNGTPLSYVGSPIGGPAEMPEPGYEIPNAQGAFASVVVQFEDTKPDVTFAAVTPSPTNDTTVLFSYTFSEPIDPATVSSSDFQVTNGSVVNFVAPGAPTTGGTVEIDPIADGTVEVSMAANAVEANDDHTGSDASNTASIDYDSTGPTVTIDKAAGQADPTTDTSILFTATFSEPVTLFTNADVVLSGTANPTTAVVTGGPTIYTVTVSGMTVNGTVIAEVAAGAVDDALGNPSSASTSTDNVVDSVTVSAPPTVTINKAAGQADPTTDTSILFTATFSEPVTLFTNADVVLSGTANPTSAVVTGGPTIYTVTVSGMSTSGTVIAEIVAGAALDADANLSEASTSSDNIVDWIADTTPPTVTINKAAGQADPTTDTSILFTATFSEPVTLFTNADVVLSGTANPTSAVVTGGPTIYTVTVSGMSTSGTVIAEIVAAAAEDAAGNLSEASTSSDNIVDWTADTTPPTVTINKAAGQPDPTSAPTIEFTATFSEPVTLFTNADVVLSGTANPTTAVVTGGPTIYTVTVSGMSNDGTVIAEIVAAAAEDAAGNLSEASTSSDNIVDYDLTADVTPPTVIIVKHASAPAQADPTNSSPIVYTVTFSEPVTGFDDGSTDVTIAGTAGGTKTAVISGGPSIYTVSVSGMTTSGTVIASIPAGAAVDAATNGNLSSATSTVTYDVVAPKWTVQQKVSGPAQPDPTNGATVQFTVTFDEPVTGFVPDNVVITPSGSISGFSVLTVTDLGAGTVYTVTVSTGTGDGTLVANLDNALGVPENDPGDIEDAAGNDAVWSGNALDNSVTIDKTAPTVTVAQFAGDPDPDNTSPIRFTVDFDGPVTGFTASDVSFAGSTAGGTLVASIAGPLAGDTYTVSVTGMTTSGNVVVSIPSGRAFDAATNGNAASTSSDNIVAWVQPGDLTPPSVTVNKGATQADPTSAPSIVFDVLFSEAVTGFTSSDVVLGGTAGATTKVVGNAGDADSATYTITVTGMSVSGTVTASIPASAAKDLANNNSLASTSSDNSVQWNLDATKPSVTVNQAAGQADPTNVGPIVFTATFDEPVTGLTNGDVTLGGTAGATTAVVSGGPTVYTVTVSGMTGSGTVTASIPAGAASDAATNTSTASTSTDNTVTYDATAPSVTIEQAGGQADPANTGPISFTATFSEAVTGFTSGDVTLGGTAGATTAVVSGGPTVYTVAVSGMTQPGTVTAAIPAAAATDAAGNASTASTSSDDTVTFDGTAPTVTINQASGQPDPATAAMIEFTATFSEAVTGFADGDITLGGTAGATTAVVTGGPTVYTVTVSGMTANGTVTAAVNANAASDGAGNTSAASTSSDNSVTWLVSSAPQALATPGGNVTIAVSPGSQLIFFTTTNPVVPPPPGVLFPYGQLSFSASTTPGGLVTFTLTLPAPATAYYKLVFASWLTFDWDGETGAQLNGTTLTITIRDNGRGDSDATPGIATDPGAVGVMAELPATGSDSRRLLWPASMLVAAGAVLLLGQRRRRPAEVSV